MKVHFYGAAGCVTGSCYLLETPDKKILIDCGMRQGKDSESPLGEDKLLFDPKEIDYLLLTHAHIDHSGLIPLIVKKGFQGKIITTSATKELCSIMLPDSGHIQEAEIEWKNRKERRAGLPDSSPLYTAVDATKSLQYFTGIEYDQLIPLDENIRVRFNDVGHLLGSAAIEVFVETEKGQKKIVFSGDIGNKDKPIIKDPHYIHEADYVVMETTYGGRLHTRDANYTKKLCTLIADVFARGGNLVIPAFSVGRTQEIIYEISEIIKKNMLPQIERIPVYVDSPLSVEATEIYKKNMAYYDEQTMNRIQNGDDPFYFDSLHYVKTSEDSKKINDIKGSKIIISSSGMCDAGRVKHHLKHNLWRKDSTILFSGYQAVGTLGRKILEGAKHLKIFGEEISVEARIEKLEGFSSHADQNGLYQWLQAFQSVGKVLLVHGEPEMTAAFGQLIGEKGYQAEIPQIGDAFDLDTGKLMSAYTPIPVGDLNYSKEIVYAILQQADQLRMTVNDCSAMLKRLDKEDRSRGKINSILNEMQLLSNKLKNFKL